MANWVHNRLTVEGPRAALKAYLAQPLPEEAVELGVDEQRTVGDHFVELRFDTKWKWPLAGLCHLASKNPNLIFTLHYTEEQLHFAGTARWDFGRLVHVFEFDPSGPRHWDLEEPAKRPPSEAEAPPNPTALAHSEAQEPDGP